MNWTVEHSHGELALGFSYHPSWVAAIKRLGTRRFDPSTKQWYVPTRLAPELAETLSAAGVPEQVLESLAPWVQEALEDAARVAVRTMRVYERVDTLPERHSGLFAYQREGVEFLLRPRAVRGCLLADDMGLGKTRQAIVAAHELSENGRILVVCPASLKLNWEREIRLALGEGPEVSVARGRHLEPARWTIVNYDLLGRHHEALVEQRWSCLILDEAHYIKNLRSQRSLRVLGGAIRGRAMRGIADRADRVMLLTGTPITNRPIDLFALLKAIGHPLGDDRLNFAIRYCAAFQSEFGWDVGGASNLDELHRALEDVMLRRRKDEVLDLPPKLRTYVPVEVDLKAYRQVWHDYVARLARKKRIPRRLLLAEVAKLRHSAAIAKIPAAISLLEDVIATGQKVVVFTSYQAVVDALTTRFGPKVVRLTGAETSEERQAAVDAFQNDERVSLFVANLKAGGVGISLTAASQVVFVDYSFTPSDHLQAEDRPCRIGQSNAITVTYLSAVGTLDEEVERLLAQKLAVVAEAIEGRDPLMTESFLDELIAVLEKKR